MTALLRELIAFWHAITRVVFQAQKVQLHTCVKLQLTSLSAYKHANVIISPQFSPKTLEYSNRWQLLQLYYLKQRTTLWGTKKNTCDISSNNPYMDRQTGYLKLSVNCQCQWICPLFSFLVDNRISCLVCRYWVVKCMPDHFYCKGDPNHNCRHLRPQGWCVHSLSSWERTSSVLPLYKTQLNVSIAWWHSNVLQCGAKVRFNFLYYST